MVDFEAIPAIVPVIFLKKYSAIELRTVKVFVLNAYKKAV